MPPAAAGEVGEAIAPNPAPGAEAPAGGDSADAAKSYAEHLASNVKKISMSNNLNTDIVFMNSRIICYRLEPIDVEFEQCFQFFFRTIKILCG